MVIEGKGMKEKVVIGLLSSPLGSGMRPDLIRHQDGPLMDMSFNPFPPGGRNGNWRGRGDTSIQLIDHLFKPNPNFFPNYLNSQIAFNPFAESYIVFGLKHFIKLEICFIII